jgi:hypothetical protein
MKKMLLSVLLLIICQAATAQVIIALLFGDKLNTDKLEFGLFGGPTFSNISDMNAQAKAGFNLGLYFNLKISNNFFLHPEAIAKEALGAEGITPYSTGIPEIDESFADGSVTRKIKAVSLPLLVRYRLKGSLYAEAGPQIDWQLRTTDIFKTEVNDDPLEYTVKPKDVTTAFSVNVAGGLVYRFRKDKGLAMGLRYCHGLTDIMKIENGKQANSAWLIHLAIPVGAGKSSTIAKQKTSETN